MLSSARLSPGLVRLSFPLLDSRRTIVNPVQIPPRTFSRAKLRSSRIPSSRRSLRPTNNLVAHCVYIYRSFSCTDRNAFFFSLAPCSALALVRAVLRLPTASTSPTVFFPIVVSSLPSLLSPPCLPIAPQPCKRTRTSLLRPHLWHRLNLN